MEPRISVIVPVYNVESYLKPCLDSIVGQDFENMEIICIDDKSTDGSLAILREYEKKYGCIRVCTHDTNRGLSAARNRGIEEAAGKYLWFVDSDDMIKPGACRMLYQCAEADDADIVYFNMDFLNDEKNHLIREKQIPHKISGVHSGRQMFCLYQRLGMPKSEAVRQFIRRDFLLNSKISFYEGILHEDLLFSFLAAMKAECVVDLNECLYIYRQRNDSIMYAQKEKSAASLFVNIVNICSYWTANSFTEEESKWISSYIEKMYLLYRYYRHFRDKSFIVGDYRERFLYSLFEKEHCFAIDFRKEDIAKLRKTKVVVLYGAGKVAAEVIDVLGRYDIKISRIVVSETNGNPKYMEGIPIEKISDLSQSEDQVIVIGTDKKFFPSIIATLEGYGFIHYIKPITAE